MSEHSVRSRISEPSNVCVFHSSFTRNQLMDGSPPELGSKQGREGVRRTPSETPTVMKAVKEAEGPAYRCGGPVLAIHKAVLAVEIIVLRELWKQAHTGSVYGNSWEANVLARQV